MVKIRTILPWLLLCLALAVVPTAAADEMETAEGPLNLYIVLGNTPSLMEDEAGWRWCADLLAGLALLYQDTDTRFCLAPVRVSGAYPSSFDREMESFSAADEAAPGAMAAWALDMPANDYKPSDAYNILLLAMEHIRAAQRQDEGYRAVVLFVGSEALSAERGKTKTEAREASERAGLPPTYFLGVRSSVLVDVDFGDDTAAQTAATLAWQADGAGVCALDAAIALAGLISELPQTVFVRRDVQITSRFEPDNRLVLALPQLDTSARESMLYLTLSEPVWLTPRAAAGEAETAQEEAPAWARQESIVETDSYTAWQAGGTSLVKARVADGARTLEIPLYAELPFESLTLTDVTLWQCMPVYTIGRPQQVSIAKNVEATITAPVLLDGEPVEVTGAWNATLSVSDATGTQTVPASITPQGLSARVTLQHAGLYSLAFQLEHPASGLVYRSPAINPGLSNAQPQPVPQEEVHIFRVDDPTFAEGAVMAVDLRPYFSDADGDALVYEVQGVEPPVNSGFATIAEGGQLLLREVGDMQEQTVSIAITATDTDEAHATGDVQVQIVPLREAVQALRIDLVEEIPSQPDKGATLRVAVEIVVPQAIEALPAAERLPALVRLEAFLQRMNAQGQWESVRDIKLVHDTHAMQWTGECDVGYDAGDYRIWVGGGWMDQGEDTRVPFAGEEIVQAFQVSNVPLGVRGDPAAEPDLTGALQSMLWQSRNAPVDVEIPLFDRLVYEEGDRVIATPEIAEGRQYNLWREGDGVYILSALKPQGEVVSSIAYDTLADAESPSLLLRAGAAGEYPLRLRVEDQEGTAVTVSRRVVVSYADSGQVVASGIALVLLLVVAVIVFAVWQIKKPRFAGTLILQACCTGGFPLQERRLPLRAWRGDAEISLSRLLIAAAMPVLPGITGTLADKIRVFPADAGVRVRLEPQAQHLLSADSDAQKGKSTRRGVLLTAGKTMDMQAGACWMRLGFEEDEGRVLTRT